MTAPTHAAFGTLCYFIVAACLWWAVSPAVATIAVLGCLLPDPDGRPGHLALRSPGGTKDELIIGRAGVVVLFMVIQFFMRKAK